MVSVHREEFAMVASVELERVTGESTGGEAILRAEGLVRRYGSGEAAVEALRGVALSLSRGELTAVMGPSGSGKSTLLHVLAGLDRPDAGSVQIEGVEITELGDGALTRLRRRRLGFVFQFFNLVPTLSAEENVVLPLRLAGARIDRAWVDELIHRVGLEHRRKARPAHLSGGEQQRVSIARALVTRPAVIFADEPTGNLDSVRGHEILELLHESVHAYGQSVLLVTHDTRVADFADRLLFLADGRIVHALDSPGADEVRATLACLPTPAAG
jgi:putative ABC transport system ATP-binding protein